MILWLLLASQPAGSLVTLSADQRAFAPYRECVLERARIYAKDTSSIDDIMAAAASDCRAKKQIALLDSLNSSLSVELANDKTDGSAVAGSNANFARLERLLREDVAATVLRARTRK
jgi:hypothetical protein